MKSNHVEALYVPDVWKTLNEVVQKLLEIHKLKMSHTVSCEIKADVKGYEWNETDYSQEICLR